MAGHGGLWKVIDDANELVGWAEPPRYGGMIGRKQVLVGGRTEWADVRTDHYRASQRVASWMDGYEPATETEIDKHRKLVTAGWKGVQVAREPLAATTSPDRAAFEGEGW